MLYQERLHVSRNVSILQAEKGLNVSRIIDFCGEEVLATGFAGGFNGAYVEDMLKKDGIPSRFTKTQSETRSCINILAEDESSTEYLEPGAPVSEEEIQQFLEDFDRIVDESDIITISGSIPAGVQKDIYATLVKMIKNKGKKVILDTSGDYLKEGIKAGPTMVKPNDEELEALLGIKIENRYQTIDAAKEMREKYGIEYVVVSLGGDGALVVCEEGIFHGKPPEIKSSQYRRMWRFYGRSVCSSVQTRKRDSGCIKLRDRCVSSECNQSRNRTYPYGRC